MNYSNCQPEYKVRRLIERIEQDISLEDFYNGHNEEEIAEMTLIFLSLRNFLEGRAVKHPEVLAWLNKDPNSTLGSDYGIE